MELGRRDFLLGSAVLLGGCRRRGPAALELLAASSLTEVLTAALARVGGAFGEVRTRFDASSRLLRQLSQGMAGDLFVSADRGPVGWLEQHGQVRPGTVREPWGNTLVVVGHSSAAPLAGPEALAGPAVRRLAIAGEQVPAGLFARQSLRSLGVWEQVQGRLLEGDSVRSVLGYVARGDADLGVVYATDARVEPRVRVVLELSEASHRPIVYAACVLSRSADPARAQALLERLIAERGVFQRAGFLLR